MNVFFIIIMLIDINNNPKLMNVGAMRNAMLVVISFALTV